MRRSLALWIGIVGALVILVLVVSQFVLPSVAANRIEHRLTKNGGSAHVSLHAFPALELLFHHGRSIEVTGNGLRVPLGTGEEKVFQNLEGFGKVHVDLTNVTAGPFRTQRFTLDRARGSSTYDLGVHASFTPSALAAYVATRVGGSLGGLLGTLAGGLTPGSEQPLPVNVRATLRSDGGTTRVVSGGGSVAGIPMGPVLVALTAGIVAQL